jgi:hypothetical protein
MRKKISLTATEKLVTETYLTLRKTYSLNETDRQICNNFPFMTGICIHDKSPTVTNTHLLAQIEPYRSLTCNGLQLEVKACSVQFEVAAL